MIDLAGLIRKLIALGASSEVIDAVAVAVQADQEREAARLEAHRQAGQRYRDRKNSNEINDRVISRGYHGDITQKPQQNQRSRNITNPPLKNPPHSESKVTPESHISSRARARARTIPGADWTPDARTLELIQPARLTPGEIQEERVKFVDYCQANGKGYADCQAAFRNWCRSPYRNGKGGSTYGGRPRQRTTFDACNDLLDRLREIEQAETGTVDNQPYQPTLGKLP